MQDLTLLLPLPQVVEAELELELVQIAHAGTPFPTALVGTGTPADSRRAASQWEHDW